MRKIVSYKGKLKGISGIWCDKKPKGLKEATEIEVYLPDNGKVFIKNNKIFKTVILKENEKIEDYMEMDI